MKKMTKALLCLLLALTIGCIGTAAFFAETIYVSGDFSYTVLSGDLASVYSWSGSGALTVPESLGMYRTKEIRNFCFNGRQDITSVSFTGAYYLGRIGVMAFQNCANLSGLLELPPEIETIGAAAFQGTGIETLEYNARTASVVTQCFYNCPSLREAYLDDGLQRIDSLAFASCGSLELVRIPKSVTEINDHAFDDSPNVVIYCYSGSYAQQFAVDKGIDYVLIDATIPTEPPTEPETEAPVPTEEPTDMPTEPVTEEPTTVPPTESEPATEPSTEIIGYILGDADGNGLVDSVDVTFIQRHLAYMPVGIPDDVLIHGDVDGNGKLTIVDATWIQRHLALMATGLPIGEIIAD